MSKFTQGPVAQYGLAIVTQKLPAQVVGRDNRTRDVANACWDGDEENEDFTWNYDEAELNAQLITAAFNAATECERAGFDGIAAVRALPKLLQELRSAFLLAHPCPDCGTIELLDSGLARCSCCDAPWDWNQVAPVRPVWANSRATLATARGES